MGGVEEMTRWLGASPALTRSLRAQNYISGQHIEIIYKDSGNCELELTWMRAGKRMALGILLHPDRMGILDWQNLRGIGPALAQRIVANRQNYGDFGTISSVTRVSGIGEKTLESMRPWFVRPTMSQN
ncbi:MAG: helix-hairpin-helix domain-containing protein [Geobacteraceae bacterium]|nr:helix-hairpin-helix domain-containing protein [Geobacteraceae bacterium]